MILQYESRFILIRNVCDYGEIKIKLTTHKYSENYKETNLRDAFSKITKIIILTEME